MTYKEARNNFVQDLAENAYLNMCSTEEMKIAIEALEKQIPKKVIVAIKEIQTEEQQGLIRYLKCPHCQRFIAEENTVHFCTYCGQALDWSEIE